MTAADIGLPFNWKYGPAPYDIGNPAFSQKLAFAFRGIGLKPLSPVHVRGEFSSGDLIIGWTRRTRIGGDGWERTEVPLGEDSEAYEVDIMNGADVVRTLSTGAPAGTYTASAQLADFGVAQASYSIRVFQVSPVFGRGQVREVIVP
jgi:hypothetical protein